MFFFFSSFIFKSFSLNINITSSNWENFTGIPISNITGFNHYHHIQLSKDQKNLPIFMFCFASWCPHCKRTLPKWQKYGEDVSEDNSFIVASVNCTEELELCQSLKIRSLPTFLTYFHGDIREVRSYNNVETFRKIGEKLSLIQQGKFLKRYENNENENKSTLSHYPSFIFSFNFDPELEKYETKIETENSEKIEFKSNLTGNDNDNEAMEIVLRAMVASNSDQSGFFYLNSTKEKVLNRRATVYISEDVWLDMSGEFTFENILDFVSENCHELFGDWSFSSIRRIRRRFAIYAPKIKKGKKVKKEKKNRKMKLKFTDLKSFAIDNLDKFAWGSIEPSEVDQFNDMFKLKTSDFPAIVVIDINMSRIAKLKKIKSRKEIEEFFGLVEFFENNEVNSTEDGRTNVFEPLEINNEMDDMFKLIDQFLSIFLFSFVIVFSVAIIVVIIYCYFRKKPAPKND